MAEIEFNKVQMKNNLKEVAWTEGTRKMKSRILFYLSETVPPAVAVALARMDVFEDH